MEKVKVLAKGQVVIPAHIRKKHGIEPGSEVQIFEYGNMIYLVPPSKDPVSEAMGCIPQTPSLSKELLLERRRAPLPPVVTPHGSADHFQLCLK